MTDHKTLLPIAVILGIAALGLIGCGARKPTAAAPQTPDVTVVTVEQGSAPVVSELPGRTSPYLVAQVRARVDGIVLSRDYTEGGDVRPGEQLYRIDPTPYRAALDSAQASLQRAEANLASTSALAERYHSLLEANNVSRQDYDNAVAGKGQAEADVAAGKAAVELAKINLGYTDVMSPIGGRIGPSLVTQGAYVQSSAATLLTTVQQIDPIYVDLNQSSVEALQLRRDMANGKVRMSGPSASKVELLLEDGTPYSLPGKLQFSDITVDPGTGSVVVRAVFPNPQHVLLPGMFVRARIEQGVDQAVLVPQIGITHDQNGQATALVVGPDNTVALRTIQASRTVADQWVVDAGLHPGERVIVAGLQKVRPGMIVKPVDHKVADAAVPAPSSSGSGFTPVADAQAAEHKQ